MLDGDEVLERLRHLLTHNVKMACVQEVVDPLVTFVVGLRLGNLVVVMREPEIDTTTVDINWPLLEVLSSHA